MGDIPDANAVAVTIIKTEVKINGNVEIIDQGKTFAKIFENIFHASKTHSAGAAKTLAKGRSMSKGIETRIIIGNKMANSGTAIILIKVPAKGTS